jgi:putative transposase
MKKHNPFRYFKTSPEIIRLAVMMYVRFTLSLRNVEDLLHERGIDISHETVRYWWNKFGLMFAREIRKKRMYPLHNHSNWKWHLDEVFLKKIMKKYGAPKVIVTDRLKSYRAAMKNIGNERTQEVGRWKNNRCENSHLSFRRREYAMLKFRQMRSLQKFVSIHSSVFNHFNKERHLNSRDTFKVRREAAPVEWQQLCAAQIPSIHDTQRLVRIRLTAPSNRIKTMQYSI